MRPLHLHITGLNSFREKVVIDFDRLLAGGLFGIFGPTGSGKSTILDAMTLALYGRVRRAPGGTQGIVNVREPHCAVSFTFEIGGEGTRRKYTVDRMLSRSKTGGVETRRMRLLRFEHGVPIPIAEKKQELKERINEILGITADDFLRAVVLPQGAFAEFLGLETRERSDVLQRLFGLQSLGDRLNALLKDRAAALLGARAELEGRLQQLRPYDDNALAAADTAIAQADERRQATRARMEAAGKEHREALALYGQIEEYRRLMDDAGGREEKERHADELRERLNRAAGSMAVQPLVDARKESLKRSEEARARHQTAVIASDLLQDALSAARTRLEQTGELFPSRFNVLSAELDVLEKIRDGQRSLHEQRELLRDVIAVHDSCIERCEEAVSLHNALRKEMGECEKEIGDLEQKLGGLAITSEERRRFEELRQALRDLRTIQEEVGCKDSEAESLRKEIASAAESLQAARDHEQRTRTVLDNLSHELGSWKKRVDTAEAELQALERHHIALQNIDTTLQEKAAVLEEKRAELAALETDGIRDNAVLAGLEQELQAALVHESATREKLRKAVADREGARQHLTLAALSGGLHEGDPCVLCGSTEHPRPYDAGSEESAALDCLESEILRLEDGLAEAERSARELDRLASEYRAAVRVLGQRMESLKAAVIADERGMEQLLAKVEIGAPAGSVDVLRNRIAEIEGRMKAEWDVIREGRSCAAELEQRVNDTRAILLEGVRQSAEIETGLNLKRNLLQDHVSLLAELGDRMQSMTAALTGESGGTSISDLDAKLQDAYERERKVEELRGRIEVLRADLAERHRACEECDGRLRESERARDQAYGRRQVIEADIERLEADLTEKLGAAVPAGQRAMPVDLLIESRSREKKAIQEEFDEAVRLHERVVAQSLVAAEKAGNLQTELDREEAAYQLAYERCAAALRERGFDSMEEVEAAAMPAEETTRLQGIIDEITADISHAAQRMEELRRNTGGRDMTSEMLASLESELAKAREEDDEAVQEFGGAQERLKECRKKNSELKQMLQQDLMHTESSATLEQLTRYLRGNAFIDFLANERLAEICRHASVQLGILTSGRLELGARPKDGFYIRDNGNGGVERLPSSLSGGETFVVSLSLALALSEAIQLGRAPLEFFFLDEGFGALDDELLDTVVSSLERIRSEHRAIGVISHVAQLRERIPRRLVVTAASERSGSTVCYEMA